MSDPKTQGQDADQRDYRELLIKYQQEMIDEFGKAMLALSGGAMGISFAFITDVVKIESTVLRPLLLLAWMAWSLSIVAILLAYYFSHLAMSRALERLDKGLPPGETWQNRVTIYASPVAIGTFLVGVLLLITFVGCNLGSTGQQAEKPKPAALPLTGSNGAAKRLTTSNATGTN